MAILPALLFYSAFALGILLEIFSLAGVRNWQALQKKIWQDAFKAFAISLFGFLLSVIAPEINFSDLSFESFARLFFFIWVAMVSFSLKEELLPHITEEKLFFMHIVSIVPLLPYMQNIWAVEPFMLIIILLITVLLCVTIFANWQLTTWMKLFYAIWYIVLLLGHATGRLITDIFMTIDVVDPTLILSWEQYFGWVLRGALITYLLIHFNFILGLIPGKGRSYSDVKKHALILTSRVSNRQANIPRLLIQLALVCALFLLNSTLSILHIDIVSTSFFLLIPLIPQSWLLSFVKPKHALQR